MKILYIDVSLSGHHSLYLRTLVNNSTDQIVLLIPRIDDTIHCKQYLLNFTGKLKNYFYYRKWYKRIIKIVQKEQPEIIHFLYGDVFYRFFGLGLGKFKSYNTIITFHHVRHSKLHNISMKYIYKNINYGVVHTKILEKQLHAINIQNVIHIEYPKFNNLPPLIKKDAKDYFNLPKDVPILAAIGGTREDKGLDILLEALKKVTQPFHLLIAGKEETFTRTYIENAILLYESKVTCVLKFLTEEEFSAALSAADFVVLPYRRIFDGASGPLGEGVALGKTIIGPNHGSLGDIIRNNHIGYTFESENIIDLAKTLNRALSKTFEYDKVAIRYKESLDPQNFREQYKQLYSYIDRSDR